MALTQADVKDAVPLKKDYKLTDDKGLFLLVETGGYRTWKFQYRFNDRQKVITLGAYPEVDLLNARRLRDEARELIADGIDPVSRCIKREVFSPSIETFEAIAHDWLERVYRFEVSEEQFKRVKRQVENALIAGIGKRVVSEATPEDLKTVLKALGMEQQLVKGKALAGKIGRIYRHGRDLGVAGFQYGAEMHKRLTGSGTQPEFILSSRDQLFNLVSAVFGRWSKGTTQAALKLSVWLLAKPGEIVNARWSDLDLEAGEWRVRVPSEEASQGYKTRIIPLPRQALELLRELEPITGRHEYVFPGTRNPKRSMRSSTLRQAIRTVSNISPLSADDLRTLAASALGEVGYQAEQIQLLLEKPDEANGNGKHTEQRRDLLQAWADYLDRLRGGKTTVH